MNLFIGFKIAEYYPNKISYMSVKNEEGFWSAGIFMIDDNYQLGDMLYSFDEFSFKTEEDALNSIKTYIEEVMKEVRTLSN